MEYLLIGVASILIVLGLLGCIVPVLPGPPLSFAGILVGHFTRWGQMEANLLLWLGIAAVVVTVLDYIIPIWATKKFGGSKRGVRGAALGLILGFFFFPPLGIVVGPFLGTLIAELTSRNEKDQAKALRSALGSFIGFLVGTGLKFAVSGVITYYYIKEIFIN